MSKVRIPINPLQVGRVGAYSMYVRNGEQIVRQRNNSSNYGESASRTEAQMLRRVKWANLVNFYKASAFWMPKAFESKKSYQTVYNAFMAANINQSTVALTKQLAEEGCCICEALQISKGSLASLDFSYSDTTNFINTGLRTNAAITGTTTVGELSAGIIATMHDFQDGDNVAWVKYVQDLNRDSEQNVHPRLLCFYYEFTLDTSSSVLLSAHPLAKYFETAAASFYIMVGDATDLFEEGIGFALIHTRRTNGLKVSSQNVYMVNTDLVEQFTDPVWVQECVDSYGVDAEVPLDPSFNPATSVRVTYRGSQIWKSGQRRAFIDATEGGELVIQGQNLDSAKSWVSFLADGASEAVRYTPLWVDSDGWHYILSSNGRATIIINKYVVCGVALSGIVIPSELPARMNIALNSSPSQSAQKPGSQLSIVTSCVNYAKVVDAEYQYFRYEIVGEFESSDLARLSYVNCSASTAQIGSSGHIIIIAAVTDSSKVAYIKLDDVIVAVFNYE